MPTLRKTKPAAMLKRVHRNRVNSILRKGGTWSGWICANKVNAGHINRGWHIGAYIEVDSLEQLREYIDNYSYYNCGYELGYRVLCWEEV